MVGNDDDGSVTAAIAERIHETLRSPFALGDVRLRVSVSMGAALRRPGTAEPAELLRQADFAMYMAKQGGKGRYQRFYAESYGRMAHRAALRQISRPRSPGVSWNSSRQAGRWRAEIGSCENLWVSINLSTLQLPSARNLSAIEAILADPAAEADKVVLEVTETALASSVDGGIPALKRLKTFGVRIAIDDFGTGYSSLSGLAELPADILKIDRSFVTGKISGGSPGAMLEGILGLAHRLNLEAIAEGIEDPEQLSALRGMGCRLGQGYLLFRPGPADRIKELLAAGTLLAPQSGAAPASV